MRKKPQLYQNTGGISEHAARLEQTKTPAGIKNKKKTTGTKTRSGSPPE